MIGNEMNRVSHALEARSDTSIRHGYERVLQLVDLTVAGATTLSLRRELLRWRECIAEQYLLPRPDPAGHRALFRVLLQLSPQAAAQIEPLGLR